MAYIRQVIVLIAIVLSSNGYAQSTAKIPYESPRSAYVALSKDPSAKLKRNAEGWEIVTVSDGLNEGLWTFAPPSHPSFPSVVKRQIVEHDGKLFVGMDVLCGGSKPACDQYVAEFTKLNEQMAREINEKRAPDKASR